MLIAEGLERRLGTGPDAFRLIVPRFALRPGDRVALVGPSGSGKSTLLSLFALALRPDRAARFALRDADGREHDATALWQARDDAALARLRALTIGFVPQVSGLLPFLSLRANIRLAQDLSGRRDEARLDRLVSRLGLGAECDRRPEDVSVGQRQRAAIARALAHGPSLLLADEPTAAVHPAQADEVLSLLRDLSDDGAAVLISTHDEARAVAAGFAVARCEPAGDSRAESTFAFGAEAAA
jgi:putative ABC transport system ATP-binding protein